MALTSSSLASDTLRDRWSRSRKSDLRLVPGELVPDEIVADVTEDVIAPDQPGSIGVDVADANVDVDAKTDVDREAVDGSEADVDITDGALEDRAEAAELRAAHATASMLRSRLLLMRLRRECESALSEVDRMRRVAADNAERFGIVHAMVTELDGLWQRTRIERDQARVEVRIVQVELEEERTRNAELTEALERVHITSTEQVREIARIAQTEIDEAFEAGAALGQRAAERVIELEAELVRVTDSAESPLVIVDDAGPRLLAETDLR